MLITKRSTLTGITHTRDIPVHKALYDAWERLPRVERPNVQRAFPTLSADDREFIISGSTPEEWDVAFKE